MGLVLNKNNKHKNLSQKIPDGIDLKVKHIIMGSYESLYFKKLNLFIIRSDRCQFECWSQLQDNQLIQNLQMNEFLNDDLYKAGHYGTIDSQYLLKYDDNRLGIYDLVNFKINNIKIQSKSFTHFYLTKNNLQIVKTEPTKISLYTIYGKQLKMIGKKQEFIQTFISGTYSSDLRTSQYYFQLNNKSFKILRKQIWALQYCFPTEYCKHFYIQYQETESDEFAVIHDKCSMQIIDKLKIESVLTDYIEVEEKQILVILTLETIFIYNTINLSLVRSIPTILIRRCSNNFMIYNQNMLQIIYEAQNDPEFKIKQI